MNKVILIDDLGNKYNANILFTLYDHIFQKNYIIYLIDNDLLASSYEKENDTYIINNSLTTKEYDMIDKAIMEKLGEAYA